MVLNDGVRGFSLRQVVRIIETTNLDSRTGPPHIRRRALLCTSRPWLCKSLFLYIQVFLQAAPTGDTSILARGTCGLRDTGAIPPAEYAHRPASQAYGKKCKLIQLSRLRRLLASGARLSPLFLGYRT
jgi:hypothetical protein